VDVSFADDDVGACASLVVVDFPDLNVVYADFLPFRLDAPYVPGFLAFREVPALGG
jgi:deoxyinosine 3'endonuclease (endonuclease V)